MSRLALFDLDDTLCDRAAAFERWAHGFRDTHRLAADAVPWLIETDRRGLLPRPEFMTAARSHFGLDVAVDELVAAYVPRYVTQYRVEPAVLDGIAQLRSEDWTVGIVTNGPASQGEKLRITGLDRAVDGYVVSLVEGFNKPDPEIFRRAADCCGVPLEGAWMVGDNPVADIGGAKLAGLQSIWIHLDREWIEPAYRPDHVVAGPVEAIGALRAR